MNSDKQISVLKHIAASFRTSKAFSQLQNCHGPLLRLRLMFLSFLQCALPPKLNNTVEHEFMIMGVQQLKDTLSILHTN